MHSPLLFLSVPGLRPADVQAMPRLRSLVEAGSQQPLTASFPAVTWPVQTNMLTGCRTDQHGVVANGFYWRESAEVEMWTAWNEKIQAPQLWDLLHEHSSELTSAVWFPMLSKGCGADYICMPAPIHNPDGSESLWCYTKPTEFYGDLRDSLGHFPLKHFWGPLANIESTAWIVDSAVLAAAEFQPRLFYLYLPHLDYAAQKYGPASPQAAAAVIELDEVLGRLVEGMQQSYGAQQLTWLVASEYVITEVDHVVYPNRLLRQAGLLTVKDGEGGGEEIDMAASQAWALVDHQFSQVFVRDADADVIRQVEQLFAGLEGVDEVLCGDQLATRGINHPRCGELVLVSSANSWQAYYWWLDDEQAPDYARSVDIHRKPGYDPVELHFDMETRGVPLDASLVAGSHGAPVKSDAQRGIVLSSAADLLGDEPLQDIELAQVVLGHFDIELPA